MREPGPEGPCETTRGLELHEVVKHYASGGELVRAVDGVSLTIGAGEILALYGPSGSGKTTLLLLAGGLLAPDAGSVRVDGVDLATLDGEALTAFQRGRIGYVSQHFNLMPGVPALENAALPLVATGMPLREARRHAAPLLERVGLAARLEHPPERLSGGERQRVALARALVNEPGLLLADEPTGNLDRRRGEQVLAQLAGLARDRGTAVLLVTHDPHAAEIADRVETLEDGCLSVASSRSQLAELGR